MSTLTLTRAKWAVALSLGASVLGCEGSVSLLPDADPALRKPPAVFSADAAKRQYEADAPKVQDSQSRAQYALILREIDLANISNKDWSNVEVWINGQYVVYCPSFDKKSDKCLYFTMFYDQSGHHFDTQNGQNPVKSLEVYRDGVLYQVTDHVAD
jgi:hypothetical protein